MKPSMKTRSLEVKLERSNKVKEKKNKRGGGGGEAKKTLKNLVKKAP